MMKNKRNTLVMDEHFPQADFDFPFIGLIIVFSSLISMV